jgi:MFS family permease
VVWRRGSAGVARRWRDVATDLTPLRRPAYRRLWGGITVSTLGTQVTQVAVQLQVFHLTGSSLSVGLVGLAGLVPLVVFGIVGGSLVDAVDRRRLGMFTSVGLAACSGVLVVQAVLGLGLVWLLYVLVAAQAAIYAVDSPTRQAIIPRLLPTRELPAANALSQMSQNVGVLAGPLLAGLFVTTVGYGAAYGLDVASFLAALYAMARLPALPPQGELSKAGLRSTVAGLRFLASRPVLWASFLADISAMVLGMRRALFPAVAIMFFAGGTATASYLYAAPAAGALLGIAVGGWFSRVRRQGFAVLGSVAVWGAAVAAFAFARSLWLGLALLAVAGGADMVSAVFRNTIAQVETPDVMRGRMQGVYTVVVAGGPRLGDLEAGAVASATSPFVAILSGGLAVIGAVGVLAVAVPSFRKYDVTASPAAAEPALADQGAAAPEP